MERTCFTYHIEREPFANWQDDLVNNAAKLDQVLAAIGPADDRSMAEARERQARLTKPAGSLGTLEDLSVRLAGLAGACPPPMPEPAAVAVFSGDHGVCARGVTPWPTEVTVQMIANFLAGGAVVNAFARQLGANVTVVDVGVAVDLDPAPGLLIRKVRAGTADLAAGPAMTRDEALAAMAVGFEVADLLVADGAGVLVTGDMGIGNTTPSAALIAAFAGVEAPTAVGRGGGADDAMLVRKIAVVEAAVARHRAAADPVAVLAGLGGLEHAAIAGYVLRAAALRVPVILDGVIAVSSALVAQALAADAVTAMIAGHRSVEPGATIALTKLGLTPLVDLGLRLGEGTGALLAVPLVATAVRALREVATFDGAGVSER
ncbi:MAG: nicotinate-nucleotide--dimethylbenzimidazole phosphoribosyltransferase [Dactylosporangium sp.]|nr:nicotinate-nucleotide--dimethylbenzimidazole phosphoribosyltransferase [Dactylosporangium sp.]NNJ63558.1 nicotinate-nucleotide--dimethylbenzimidazole phosphoribosyltransferase [Dactylosporangium sp.]